MWLRRLADSLVVRLVAFSVAMILVTLAGRTLFLADALRKSIQEQVTNHLFSLATYVASDIDGKIRDRQRLIENLARELPTDLLGRPQELGAWLAQRHTMMPLFSLGIAVDSLDGKGAIADYPPLRGRHQLDFSANDWFLTARDKGHFAIGKPQPGRLGPQGIIVMAAPVRDGQGRVVAVIHGVTALDAPGFLDLIQNNSIGKTGGYLLISPHDNVFVAATMPRMRLQPLPAPGLNKMHDLAMDGYRGTGIAANAFGVEELVAIVSVPAADWFLVARMPTAEAFESVDRLRGLVWQNGLWMAVGVLVLIVLFLRHVFRPVTDAARDMRRMAGGTLALRHLPVTREDEIGTMIASFNQLVDRLNENEAILKGHGLALEQAVADLRENEMRMAHMAYHDTLTGLPNRALFEDRLRQAIARAERSGKRIALLFLDLDGFKPVNDTHGHGVGDEVLRQVAERLGESVRRADTVARLGGDEFVVVLADLDDPRPIARAVAEKCIETIAPVFLVDGLRIAIGLSVGIALFPEDGDGAATLIAHADQAMYRTKQNGRGRHEFFRNDP